MSHSTIFHWIFAINRDRPENAGGPCMLLYCVLCFLNVQARELRLPVESVFLNEMGKDCEESSMEEFTQFSGFDSSHPMVLFAIITIIIILMCT